MSVPEKPWKIVLTVVALVAAILALYLQFFERRARQEEARLAASRLDEALAASRTRLKAEILAELRADLSKARPPADKSTQPVPGAVLRRREADEDAGSELGQAVDPSSLREAGGLRMSERFATMSKQMDDSDRALRKDLEELRAMTRRELDVASRATSLIAIALIAVVLRLVGTRPGSL